ncbi:hypothetical protein [Oceanospirillum sediminis]|uniref:Uncharacterized protein n=1 Tax=Oceanospirillum sediminis TaxID=2760088 RepID=A0A839IVI7_9GAMM|nr:hypothetical protein [Oceanospirillum sediminis]MBB1489365.1 hypothetical protein [Oceanospirillum sediminis]
MIFNRMVFTAKSAVAGSGLAFAVVGGISFAVALPDSVFFAGAALGGVAGAVLGLSARDV